MNSVLSGFSLSLFVESHLIMSSRQCASLSRAEATFLCEMHIQLCVISIELETNTRMILYDFTQQSSTE